MAAANKNKALFLDRDGTLNVEKNYVYKVEDFEFTDGIIELIKAYQKDGFLIFVITNQAGIARGYYTEQDYQVLTEWMTGMLKSYGIKFRVIEKMDLRRCAVKIDRY